jgi:RING-box protein 1
MSCLVIKSISLRGYWNLDTINDECPICRNTILETCVECSNVTDSNCISIMGECSHVYHLHCIEKWTKTKNVCPLDNKKWEYKKPKCMLDSTCTTCNTDLNKKNYVTNSSTETFEFTGSTGPTGSSESIGFASSTEVCPTGVEAIGYINLVSSTNSG